MSNFIDYAKVNVQAGKGGDGIVAFRREKYVPDGGPAGGDGGRGGDVIFRVDEGLSTLMDFRYNRHFKAKNGENGMSKSKYGAGADDLIVMVPQGTLIRHAETGQLIADLKEHDQEVIIAKGGRGGRGNKRFATHRNPAPSIAENGEPGEELDVILELKLLADVGLVGYPSVGKSTLLSVVSNATPKIADYQFTTLAPNLGLVDLGYGQEFVLADMPGIIEGASEGVGLGLTFLRHIERTKVLLHIIDMAATHGRDPYQDFIDIMEELENYNPILLERPMIIVANKMDLPSFQENLEEFTQKVNQYYQDHQLPTPDIVSISAYQTKGVDDLMRQTYDLLQSSEYIPLEEETVEEVAYYTVEEEEKPFEIHQLGEGYWEITGDRIVKLYRMTNMSHDESIARFSRQMRSMGIDQTLRDLGAQSGDIVELDGFQFEFMD